MVTATAEPQASFWHGMPSDLQPFFEEVMPSASRNATLPEKGDTKSVESRLGQLAILVEAEIAQRSKSTDTDPVPETGPSSCKAALHLLGCIYHEQNKLADAERVWRKLLEGNDPSTPNLAALSNWAGTRWQLADVRKDKQMLAEAEVYLRMLVPLLQLQIGKESPQALGALRMLIPCVLRLGRREEALTLWRKGMELVKRMTEETVAEKELKEDERVAMEEVGKQIDVSG